MLRHTGERRSFAHNLRLAVLLCLNAGFINAAGFMSFAVLTTNVTGHAALLAVNLSTGQWRAARMVALWLLLFLAGAFTSSLYIAKVGRDKSLAYTAPIMVVVLIVLTVAVFGHDYQHTLPQTEYFAGSLLFAMGMQNALVSIVSGAEVRTTHLTGMFTDLGIDLAGALLSRRNLNPAHRRRMLLRLVIIIFFLLGGLGGGFAFVNLRFSAFFIPAALLLIVLFYDYFRVRVKRALRPRSR
ncbi:YoaK family protein [Mucilaginibacter sp. CAU 1740]|uniref:YoaK family protein n=1 Tax=Mucilaginibacter sp. CAU 1740 TaxID=3140365 RepID=UPI00325B46ED